MTNSGEIQKEFTMEDLEEFLKSSTSDGTMQPGQKMMVAAVSLGISDARGCSSELPFLSPPSFRILDFKFSTSSSILLGRHLHFTWGERQG